MTIHIEIGEMSGGCISVDSPSLGLFHVNHVLMNTELDPVYTIPDSRSHDIKFGQFANIYTFTAFSLISCC